jgi:hypothetical protein
MLIMAVGICFSPRRVVQINKGQEPMRKSAPLPAGGPLKIDVVVAELLLAQLAIMCAPRDDQQEKEAAARRRLLMESMDPTQRGHARTARNSLAAVGL